MNRYALHRGLAGLGLLLGCLLAVPAIAKDTVTYYLTDSLHSVVVELDAQRNVLSTTHYGPYGLVLDRSMRDGPGYGGHEEDPAAGLDYMQQRYYDPQAGRFVSTDPVLPTEDGGNFNRYWYAADNPYKYVDPNGADSWLVARPTPFSSGPADHMFIVVAPALGATPTARFSYGPSHSLSFFSARPFGSLVEQNGSNSGTNKTDQATWAALGSGHVSSQVHIIKINASDAAVIASGAAVDSELGTVKKPGSVLYLPDPRVANGGAANSNSAAIAVANGALGDGQQPLPDGTNPIGWQQWIFVAPRSPSSSTPKPTQTTQQPPANGSCSNAGERSCHGL